MRALLAPAIALAIAVAGLAAMARAAAKAAEPTTRRFLVSKRRGNGVVPPHRSEWFAPDAPIVTSSCPGPIGK